MEDYDDGDSSEQSKQVKKGNILPLWGNERSMNLNPLILTNIQSSHYFKVNLYELKTYHEVIDEIYYKVSHLEPWEKGSRKTAGQTGMCGGVRGVGAGGIVSTAYCLLYKLFTLRLTRKQLNGLINHTDSPYIRALGFMYIRYTQPPADLFDWYEDYLEDAEEMDVKAGGGQVLTMGDLLRAFLTKLEWFSTLFPRIPVPIQQKNEKRLNERFPPQAPVRQQIPPQQQQQQTQQQRSRNIPEPGSDFYSRGGSRGNDRGDRWNDRTGGQSRDNNYRERSPQQRDGYRDRSPQRDRDRSPQRDGHRDRSRHEHKERDGRSRHDRRDGDRDRERGKEREHRHRDERPRHHHHHHHSR